MTYSMLQAQQCSPHGLLCYSLLRGAAELARRCGARHLFLTRGDMQPRGKAELARRCCARLLFLARGPSLWAKLCSPGAAVLANSCGMKSVSFLGDAVLARRCCARLLFVSRGHSLWAKLCSPGAAVLANASPPKFHSPKWHSGEATSSSCSTTGT